jgi:hypothetical protein
MEFDPVAEQLVVLACCLCSRADVGQFAHTPEARRTLSASVWEWLDTVFHAYRCWKFNSDLGTSHRKVEDQSTDYKTHSWDAIG